MTLAHNTAVTRTLAGRIAYRGGNGVEIGRERFELIPYSGGYTLRAWCEMDDIGLLRDVTLSLDERWRPIDAFSRVLIGGRRASASLFLAEASGVHCAGVVEGGGRVLQQLPTDQALQYLGLHPLSGDALIVAIRGEHDPGVFWPIQSVTNSISANGDTGFHATPVTIAVAFLGFEEVSVAAGCFRARRFALKWQPQWPAADLWVRDQDCVFLQMRWEMISSWYELTELNASR